MISYKKRTKTKTESDIYRESENNRKTREIRIPEPKERTPAPREAYDLNEHLNKSIRHPVSGRAYPGSLEAT